MKNQQETTLFAFKLAENQDAAKPAQQWKVREGVSVAGCTDVNPDHGLYRASNQFSADGGVYC